MQWICMAWWPYPTVLISSKRLNNHNEKTPCLSPPSRKIIICARLEWGHRPLRSTRSKGITRLYSPWEVIIELNTIGEIIDSWEGRQCWWDGILPISIEVQSEQYGFVRLRTRLPVWCRPKTVENTIQCWMSAHWENRILQALLGRQLGTVFQEHLSVCAYNWKK